MNSHQRKLVEGMCIASGSSEGAFEKEGVHKRAVPMRGKASSTPSGCAVLFCTFSTGFRPRLFTFGPFGACDTCQKKSTLEREGSHAVVHLVLRYRRDNYPMDVLSELKDLLLPSEYNRQLQDHVPEGWLILRKGPYLFATTPFLKRSPRSGRGGVV